MAEIEPAFALQVFLNEEPVSRSSVMSFFERFLIRDWRTMKRPRKNWPLWSFLRLACRRRCGLDPPVRGVERGADRDRLRALEQALEALRAPWRRRRARPEPAGSFTNTSPETTVALTVLNGIGLLGAVVGVAAVVDPVLVGVAACRNRARRRRRRRSPARTAACWRCRPPSVALRGRDEGAGGGVGVATPTRRLALAPSPKQPRDRDRAGPVVARPRRRRARRRRAGREARRR